MTADVARQLLAEGGEPKQMSAYFPSRRTAVSAPRRAAALKLGLFVLFVLTRAFHPMLIDLSKVDGKIMYLKNTPVVMNKMLTIVLMNCVSLLMGGVEGVKLCWQPRCMAVFGMIGTIYAFGDFLEMLSMSKMNGGVYQVLLQTKLLITALISWRLKGVGQTSLQWHVLLVMFLATSCFVVVDQGGGAGGADLPLLAIASVLLKVAVSCYCAVLSEKYLKAFADMPLPAKISGMATTWALASLVICLLFEPKVRRDGFFSHWNAMTWLVTMSFVIKTTSTMYLLQALDSMQKNIGEALAVIVIYAGQVLLPSIDKAFDLSAFLLALLVVCVVRTYLVSPKLKAKAKASRSTIKVVSVSNEKPHVDGGVVQDVTCELEEAPPAGVFYGMLGGLYPVCGKASPGSGRSCELSFLAHPPSAGALLPNGAADVEAPSAVSLTVFGSLREARPGDSASPSQCPEDMEQARARVRERLTQQALF